MFRLHVNALGVTYSWIPTGFPTWGNVFIGGKSCIAAVHIAKRQANRLAQYSVHWLFESEYTGKMCAYRAVNTSSKWCWATDFLVVRPQLQPTRNGNAQEQCVGLPDVHACITGCVSGMSRQSPVRSQFRQHVVQVVLRVGCGLSVSDLVVTGRRRTADRGWWELTMWLCLAAGSCEYGQCNCLKPAGVEG